MLAQGNSQEEQVHLENLFQSLMDLFHTAQCTVGWLHLRNRCLIDERPAIISGTSNYDGQLCRCYWSVPKVSQQVQGRMLTRNKESTKPIHENDISSSTKILLGTLPDKNHQREPHALAKLLTSIAFIMKLTNRDPSSNKYRIPWCFEMEPSTGSLYSNSSPWTTLETSLQMPLTILCIAVSPPKKILKNI